MKYKFKRVEAIRYPIIRITFDDGLVGEVDFSRSIRDMPIFAPLKDEGLFNAVRIGDRGRTYGWRLDEPGQEIDLCVDATRIEIETTLVAGGAEEYRRQRVAAE